MKENFTCTNCIDRGLETKFIRDLFAANMSYDKVQKDLLARTKTPVQAFEYAIRRQKGLIKQFLIRDNDIPGPSNQLTNVKSEPVGFIQKRGNTNIRYSQRQQQQQRNYERHFTDQKHQGLECRKLFGPGHLQQCPAKDKICKKKCTKRGYYAQLSKSSHVNVIQENQNPEQPIQDTDMAA